MKMFSKLENSRYMQYLCAVTATLTLASTASYTVWTSPSLPILQSEDSPIGRPITDEEGSWIVSLHKLALVPAAILSAYTLEKIGRKQTLLLAGVFLFVPWFMIIFGTNIAMLYTARFVSGIGAGMSSITCTIYNAEIAENDIRGKLGTSLIVLKLVGALIVLTVGPYVSYTWLAIISATMPVVFIGLFAFMPETPYYLMKAADQAGAEKNLKILSSKSIGDKFIASRLEEIDCCVQADMQNKTTVWEFLTNKEYRTAIFLVIGLRTLQQLSGTSAIDGYMQSIVELSNSNISSEASSIIFGFVQLPAALLSSVLVDRVGRKPLLLISAIGCAAGLFMEGTYFYFQDALEADTSAVNWLPTFGITVYLIMNPLGILTLTYVVIGEFFPTNIKGIAVSTAAVYSGGVQFLVTKYFKPSANAFGMYSVFWFFGSVCALGAIFVQVFLPETKGKSFAEIQAIWKKGNKKKSIEIECKDSTIF